MSGGRQARRQAASDRRLGLGGSDEATPLQDTANYNKDLTHLLRKMALEAKKDSLEAAPESRDYANGRLMAFHTVLSLMQSQARAFGIDLAELGLDGINPDVDLL